ncbi:hypothetical protein AZF37_02465 [endosymbiont 'TC1' of Trimyema compressum]|uniref:Hsp33 family molecular chaperone HslO n=1 Tax=endosymbiont 'TC1' of Trimyema compressum TaxID=243899 RepID=UPI0007F11EC5|nr:Hsp33 family molecular chaperone HslO [endosymbiont 'TC1' of Trimyema compressum]AMP20186.1 hypothetical protein AZF37_02465 [endosymbiont 'TC1' of Trimyema compressum]
MENNKNKVDYCLRGVAMDGMVRFFCTISTNLCEEARRRHDTYPTVTAALGRTLTAAVMMGMTLKGEEIISIRFKGNGPLGTVMAEGNSFGEVKGYVDFPKTDIPRKDNGKLDVGTAVGEGMLYISKDIGMKEPYTGSVPILTGEIGDDLTEYFYASEQVLSAVGVGVLVDIDYSVKSAGGFMIQLMPDARLELGVILDERIKEMPMSISDYFIHHTPEELVQYFFDEDYKILDKKEVSFLCKCSKDNFEKALISLGESELTSLSSDEGIEVVCQYCNEKYWFPIEEIKELIKSL